MAVFIVLMVLFGFLFSGIWNPRDIDLHEYKGDTPTSASPTSSATASPTASPTKSPSPSP